MRVLFLLNDTRRPHPQVDAWFAQHTGLLGDIARRWFGLIRDCGDDVVEVLHDGQPTACVGGAAFAYVGVYRSHVSIGFFQGSDLPDPAGILVGEGKHMRHVKIRPESPVNVTALSALIDAAYADVKASPG